MAISMHPDLDNAEFRPLEGLAVALLLATPIWIGVIRALI